MSEEQQDMVSQLATLYGQFARLIHEANELDMWNVESEEFQSICKTIGAAPSEMQTVIFSASHVVNAYTYAEMTEALRIGSQGECNNQEIEDAQE